MTITTTELMIVQMLLTTVTFLLREEIICITLVMKILVNSPVIVGEWSLATSHSGNSELSITLPDAAAFYRQWFGAQIHSYENQRGWVFWTWKVNLQDWRWGYQQAIQAGAIPTGNPQNANNPDVCSNLH
jgi:hypothetical protein